MKEKYELLDLKSDWVFKRIFGKEGNEKEILAPFLSQILNLNITKVELRNTELTKDEEEQKNSVLDIKAELNDNSIVDIEVQIENEHNIASRDIHYLTKLYSEQLKLKQEYTSTKKVIIINILNFNYYKINTYHSIAHMKFEPYSKDTFIAMYDKEDNLMTDKLEIHTIELPKFRKARKMCESELDAWLWLLSGEREMVKMALSKKAKAIEKAYEQLEYLSQDRKARQEYDDYVEYKLEQSMKMHYAEEKGIKAGIEQGTKQEKTEIAKKMLKMEIDINVIMEATELTKEEIEKIMEDK